MQKRKIQWGQLIFGLIWLIGAILIFALYKTDNLSNFPVPRIIWIVYKALGVEIGSLVQVVLSLIIVGTSFQKK